MDEKLPEQLQKQIASLSLKIIRQPDERSVTFYAKRCLLYWKVGKILNAKRDAKNWLLFTADKKGYPAPEFCLIMLDHTLGIYKDVEILERLKVFRGKYPNFKPKYGNAWKLYQLAVEQVEAYIGRAGPASPATAPLEIIKFCKTAHLQDCKNFKLKIFAIQAHMILGEFSTAKLMLTDYYKEFQENNATPVFDSLWETLAIESGDFDLFQDEKFTVLHTAHPGRFKEKLRYWPKIKICQILMHFINFPGKSVKANLESINSCLLSYVQHNQNDYLALIYRAFILLLDNRIPKAIKNCDLAIKAQPESVAAYTARAIIKATAAQKYSSENAKKTLYLSAVQDLQDISVILEKSSSNLSNNEIINYSQFYYQIAAFCNEKISNFEVAYEFYRQLKSFKGEQDYHFILKNYNSQARCLYYSGCFRDCINLCEESIEQLKKVKPSTSLDFSELIRIKNIATVEFNEVSEKLVAECNRTDVEYIKSIHCPDHLCQVFTEEEKETESNTTEPLTVTNKNQLHGRPNAARFNFRTTLKEIDRKSENLHDEESAIKPPNTSHFKLLLARATAVLKNFNSDKNVALRIFEEINGELMALRALIKANKISKGGSSLDEFYYFIPYLVNFSVTLSDMNFNSRAFLLLEQASNIIDKLLIDLPTYQYNRIILCAIYTWTNMDILLKNFGIDDLSVRDSFIENWNEKQKVIEKHANLFL